MEAYENESTKKGASDNFYKKEAWFFSLISYFLTYAILFFISFFKYPKHHNKKLFTKFSFRAYFQLQ